MAYFRASQLVFDLPVILEDIPVPQLRRRVQRKVAKALRFLEGKRISLRSIERARRAIKRVIKPYLRSGVLVNAWYSKLDRDMEWRRRAL